MKAEKGDLDAINWLESRGKIELPNKDHTVAKDKQRKAHALLKIIVRNAEDGNLEAVAWLENRGLFDMSVSDIEQK